MLKKIFTGTMLLLLYAVVAVSSVSAGEWTVSNLTPTGAIGSGALAFSGGQQVGKSNFGYYYHAGFWSGTAESFVDLNPTGAYTSQAYGVSNGQQVGYAGFGDRFYDFRASLWSGTAESWVDLHPAGAIQSCAYSVSNGQQVGEVFFAGIGYHAGIWSGSAESWVDLNPEESVDSCANAVSGSQQVGYASWPDPNPAEIAHVRGYYSHAGMWNGTAESWVDLNPAGAIDSEANAVSNGQQVGVAYFDGRSHAGIWSGSASSWVDLNPAGAIDSEAYAVSNGQQVGSVDGHAGLWNGTAESWVDLSMFLPVGIYSYSQARGIFSSDGTIQIAGFAHNIALDRDEAIMWTQAVPEPTSILALLCGLGGLAGVIRRKPNQ